jgi:hypothetical protein
MQAVRYKQSYTDIHVKTVRYTYRYVRTARYKYLGGDSQVHIVRYKQTIPDNQFWIDNSDKFKQPNTYNYRQLITDSKVQTVRHGHSGTVRQTWPGTFNHLQMVNYREPGTDSQVKMVC